MKKVILMLIAATSLFAAPQVIVFDFGGVMTTKNKREGIVEFLCNSFQLSPEEFERVNLEKRKALKVGSTDEEFWLSYAERKGIELPASWKTDFQNVLKDGIGVNPEMYELVAQLKEKEVKVGLFSNIDFRLSKLIRQFGLYEPFEPCLLSCEVGLEKPDPKAYAYLVEKIGISASEIVFIDDKQENIDSAKEAGIDAILFQSPEQLKQELRIRKIL
ncbi:MAG: HAD family phosphatase [Verrucomicrobia bacterium]|nr:HAD family phosphatase [Verrucomicrobiota bacterium]